MDRDEAGFSELRLTDMEDTVLEVHVRAGKRQNLVRPKASGRKQSDDRCIGVCAQSLAGMQSRGLGYEPLQFVVGINVWRITPTSSTDEPVRRNLIAWFGRVEPYGETPHDAQAPSPGGTLCVFRLHRPAKRQLRGNELRTLALHKLHKLTESYGRFTQLCAKRSPHGDVLRQHLGHGAHRSPPVTGHGWATVRNASKATRAYTVVL